MKKIILSILVIFISISLNAQNEQNFKSFYKAFKKEKSIIGISAPIGLANLFIDRDEKELRNIIKKGKKVRILVFDEITKEINTSIKSFLPSNKYQKFMSIKDGDSFIELLVRDNMEYISEMIILIHDDNSLVAMGIYGEFSYNDLKKLSDNFQTQG